MHDVKSSRSSVRPPTVGDPPAERLLRYAELPARVFRRLPLDRTLAVLPLGPLEVHGPHLPLGTDPLLATDIARRVMLRFLAAHPDRFALELPACVLGADVIAHPGSVDYPDHLVRDVVVATGESLARSGLWGLLVITFHGGPRHGNALEQAVRTLRRRHPGFLALAPMGDLFGRIFVADPALRTEWCRRLGWEDKDVERLLGDMHAGRLETSAMLAAQPAGVHPDYATLPRERPDPPHWQVRAVRLLELLGPLLGRKRMASFVRDATVGLDMLSWARRPWLSYMGDPAKADAATGEQFLDLLAAETAVVLEDIVSGRRRPEDLDPLAWTLRWILKVGNRFPWVGDAPA